MPLSNLEYIPLRLIRKFLLRDNFLLKYGKFLPYYKTNQGQIAPSVIVQQYKNHLESKGQDIPGNTILEIGSGITNSVGYEIVGCGAEYVYCLEPFVSLNRDLDLRLLNQVSSKYHIESSSITKKTRRIKSLSSFANESIDIILSNAVLEHVQEPETLFCELKRTMKKDGCMLHLIDYRDHFLKYPYHFLQFSKSIWDRFLDPGDLPRYRLGDHLRMLESLQLHTEVLEHKQDRVAFEKIKPYITSKFNLAGPYLGVCFAIIFVQNKDL